MLTCRPTVLTMYRSGAVPGGDRCGGDASNLLRGVKHTQVRGFYRLCMGPLKGSLHISGDMHGYSECKD